MGSIMTFVTQDDETVGQLLSRRRMVALLGATGTAWLTAIRTSAAMPSPCVVRPQQTEGPFFFDDRLHRRDIRDNRPGKALDLTLFVSRLHENKCEPLPGAVVDIWQCDAVGEYSDDHLRGYQVTDDRGAAHFLTIYPGWYSGRTIHIHFKIRSKNHEFTSQLYFDDALTDLVAREAPYARNEGRRILNRNDGIYRRGGDQLTLDVIRTTSPFAATFAVAMQF